MAAIVVVLSLELYQPTFGKRAHKTDLSMPADDYCLYHCINYALSNGAAELTTTAAMRFRAKVAARLRDDGLSEQATRLLQSGSAGYPDEPDFAAIAAVAGFSFAIVQDTIPEPLVYGSELGRVRMTLRRHFVADGAGHRSPHYDIVSYEWRPQPSYESLPSYRLDAYSHFLQSCIQADATIGNTALVEMLERDHGVSA